MKVLAAIALAGVLLAGCSGKDAPAESGLEATSNTGLVRGVIVDDAIRPLEGALVKLTGPATDRNLTTDASGEFGFDGLEAGSYFVRASKAYHDSVQQTVVVVAGVEEPESVRVVLTARPDLKPFVLDEAWDGYIECSFRVGTGPLGQSLGVNACNDLLQQEVDKPFTINDPSIALLQAELTWEDSQSLGSSMSFVAGPPDCTDTDWARMDGGGPLVHRLYRVNLAAFQALESLCFRVFVWTTEDTQNMVGAAVAQDFRVYFHQFYNFVPPADWQFSTHGEPPTPGEP